MSAIARYFNGRGVEVHGYDKTETTLTKTLVGEGMEIHYDENLDRIPENIDLVIYTPAVPATHLELQYFLNEKYPVKKRAEVLGIISRSMKTVAIAGTHGKTTTSSMVTHLLRTGGIDCTAFLGGIAQNYQSNFVEGQSDWVVVEADEYDRSFLHLAPDLAIILSMDADHLDIYGDHGQLHETGFKAFAKKLKPQGQLWLQADWADQIATNSGSFGVEKGDYCAEKIRVVDGFFEFDFTSPTHHFHGLQLAMAGRHNVENATAAIIIALQLGVEESAIRAGLKSFKGIKRRFEIVYRGPKVVFIDDYAHHPTELKAAINAARELFPERKVTGVFQPHLFSRTRDFADGFAEALSALDEVLLLDIYPARELPIPGVTADMVFDKIDHAQKQRITLVDFMTKLPDLELDILLTLGAGDINTLVEPINEWLKLKNLK